MRTSSANIKIAERIVAASSSSSAQKTRTPVAQLDREIAQALRRR